MRAPDKNQKHIVELVSRYLWEWQGRGCTTTSAAREIVSLVLSQAKLPMENMTTPPQKPKKEKQEHQPIPFDDALKRMLAAKPAPKKSKRKNEKAG